LFTWPLLLGFALDSGDALAASQPGEVFVPDLNSVLGTATEADKAAISCGLSAVKAHVIGTATAELAIGALTEKGTAGLRAAMWPKIAVDYATGLFKDSAAYTEAYCAIERYGEDLTNAVLARVTPAGGGAAASDAGGDQAVAAADATAQARGPRLKKTLEDALKDLRTRHANAKLREDK
jgi:hypothetical protein